jgi:hypothetical protein
MNIAAIRNMKSSRTLLPSILSLATTFVVSAMCACASSAPPPEEKKSASTSALEQGDDDQDTQQPSTSSSGGGWFSNYCRAEVQFDLDFSSARPPYCSITTWCGGWSTSSVVVSGPDDDPPCACECQ